MWTVWDDYLRRRAPRQGVFPRRVGAIAILCALSLSIAQPSPAAEITFTLDPSMSHVRASAEIVPLDAPLSPQGPESDLASYSGTVTLEIDDPLAPTSIQLLGGSVAAAITGDWLPEVGGGSTGGFLPGNADPGDAEPANYGLTGSQLGVGTMWLAFRDLVLSPTSDPLPIADGTFAADSTFLLGSGSADYTVRSVFFGDRAATEPLAGDEIENTASAAASYSVENGIATMQFPIELLDVVEDESTGATLLELRFSGSVTATAMVGPAGDADIDGDGDVDGDDLLDMLLGFGTDEAMRAEGDANGDGQVDRADWRIWQEQVGRGIAAEMTPQAVPEPSGILVLSVAATLLIACRLGRRLRT